MASKPLRITETALVLVDVQGRLATMMHRSDELFANIRKLISGAKLLGIPILWNEQLPDKLGETVPEIKAELSGLSPLTKSCFSCCGNPEFMKALGAHKRRSVLVCGIETHICVFQTCRDLIDADYQVHLAADAVSSRTERNRDIAIDRIKDLGGVITSVEMALFELLQTADGKRFRDIIKIIK